ncbi:MAG: carbohydrate ABC transporter permease [Caldilineaceae bacterium]
MNLTEATSGQFLPSQLHWENYVEAWQDAKFSLYFMNSVRITLIATTGEVVFGSLAAYAFARMEFPGKGFLLCVVALDIDVTRGRSPGCPTLSPSLGSAGLGPIPWINNWPALTVPFMATAFGIFLLRQFQQIPNELWDSAQIDGAGHLRYLLQVMVPLSVAPIMTLVLFGFIGSWNALAWPFLSRQHRIGGPFPMACSPFLMKLVLSFIYRWPAR